MASMEGQGRGRSPGLSSSRAPKEDPILPWRDELRLVLCPREERPDPLIIRYGFWLCLQCFFTLRQASWLTQSTGQRTASAW